MTTLRKGILLALLSLPLPALAASTATPLPLQAAFAAAERAVSRGDATAAITMLDSVADQLRNDGDIASDASLRCRALLAQQRYADAEGACTLAIESRVSGWSDYNNRAVVRLKRNDIDGALADLEVANQLRPGRAAVRKNLALARRLQQP